jgi:hypothetical protein
LRFFGRPVWLVVALMVLAAAASAVEASGGRIVVGVGPWWGWWGGWPGWYYPPAYYPYYPYYPYYAPPSTVTEPPVYIQRELEVQPVPQAYWHYCESAAAYYPAVQSCPEPWLKVPPRD